MRWWRLKKDDPWGAALGLLIAVLLWLVWGCTVPATAKRPGLYECKPTNPEFAHLEPIRFDSRTADGRADLPPLEGAITLTSIEGKRVRLRQGPAWECEILIDFEAER